MAAECSLLPMPDAAVYCHHFRHAATIITPSSITVNAAIAINTNIYAYADTTV